MRKLKQSILATFLGSLVFLGCAKGFEPWITENFIDPQLYVLMILALYGWIPGVIAIAYMKKEKIAIPLFKGVAKSFSPAIGLTIILTFLTILLSLIFCKGSLDNYERVANFGIYAVFSNSYYNMAFYALVVLLAATITSMTVNFICVLGEEFMWRGYLFEKLKCLGLVKASFFIGVIGGLWMSLAFLLFSINFPDYPLIGCLITVVFHICITPLCLYFRVRSKGLAAPVFFHAMVNTYTPFSNLFFLEEHPLLAGSLGIAGLLALVSLNLLMMPKYKAMMANESFLLRA